MSIARAALDAYDSTGWVGLFGAQVSASAALTGLIFVAVSINLKRILDYASLPRRVLKAVFMLVYVLFVSTVMLAPGQPSPILGLELLAFGSVALAIVVVLEVGTWRVTEAEFRRGLLALMSIGVGSATATAVAGVGLLAHAGGGIYWLVPAVLLAFTAALADAWVLLIEIVRRAVVRRCPATAGGQARRRARRRLERMC